MLSQQYDGIGRDGCPSTDHMHRSTRAARFPAEGLAGADGQPEGRNPIAQANGLGGEA